MTPEQLAEIRARAEAATPGPWECIESFRSGEYTLAARLPDEAFPLTLAIVGNDDAWEDTEANTQFVAHARTDIPALLDYIEALKDAFRRVTDLFMDTIQEPKRAGVIDQTDVDQLNELQAWANTIRNPATPFRCEEIADGIDAVIAKLK